MAGRVPSVSHDPAASVPGRITPLVRRDARCAKYKGGCKMGDFQGNGSSGST